MAEAFCPAHWVLETENGGTRTGAAIYSAADDTTILIHTGGAGVNNTITRAELSAISIALTGEDRSDPPHTNVTIITDSLTSLHLICKAMRRSMQLAGHKHIAPLDAIVEVLIHRSNARHRAHIEQVRAHIGIHRNEIADKGANQACGNNAMHTAHVDMGSQPYGTRYWPTCIETTFTAPIPITRTNFVQNLHADLKHEVHEHCKLGFSNPLSYFKYWSSVSKAAHRHLSNALRTLKTIPYGAKRYVLQHRGGVLYNEKFAVVHGRQLNGLCPMCHLSDSAGHMLGGCLHRHAKGVIITRHNQEISAGDKGYILTIVDAGIEDQHGNDEEPDDVDDTLQEHQDTHDVVDLGSTKIPMS